MSDREILDIFYGNKNKINPHLTSDEFLNNNINIKQYLLNRYNDSFSIQETLYRIKNNIDIHPLCPVCGKPVKYLGGRKGFREACSVSCSKHIIKNVNDDIIDKNVILNNLVINGELNNNKLQEKYLKEHGYYNYLNSIYKDSMNLSEKIYRLYYNINELPICKECGKTLGYKNFKIGYGDFCIDLCKQHYKLRNKNITDSDIINLLFENDKPIYTRFDKDFLICNHIYNYIINRFNDSTCISETIYRIKNNLEIRPLCKVCGKPTNFINYKYGFANTCSHTCTYTFNSTHEKEKNINDNYIKDHYLSSNNRINGMQLRKIQLMNDGTYNYLKNRFQNCGINEAVYRIKNNIEEKPKCPICGNETKFKTIHTGYSECCSESCTLKLNTIKKYKQIGYDISVTNNRSIIIKNCCEKHGDVELGIQTFWRKINNNNEILCPICNPHNTTSIEDKVIKILDKHNIKYYIHDRYQIYPLELDLFLPEYNIGIECNGIYWHSDINVEKNQHINKFNICKKHNIKLLTFWETDINNYIDKIESIILDICNLNKNIINAKNCIIKEISSIDAKKFLNTYHIYNNINASIKYGLFYNNELIEVMLFGKMKTSNKLNNGEYELYRICSKNDYTIIDGDKKLFQYFKDNNNWKSIICYSQNDIDNNIIYENLGFIFNKDCGPDYWYYDRFGNKFNKNSFRKNKINDGSGRTTDKIIKSLGYLKCWNSGSKKYIMYNN